MTMGAAAALPSRQRASVRLTRGDKTFLSSIATAHSFAFGDKLFTRSHGLRIDREGNLWATTSEAMSWSR
jgi:hypothetical protein